MKRKALLSLFALIAVFSLLAFTPEAKAAEYPDKTRFEFVLHSARVRHGRFSAHGRPFSE